eukprot:3007799-Pyramimonas_sp.AAC.1
MPRATRLLQKSPAVSKTVSCWRHLKTAMPQFLESGPHPAEGSSREGFMTLFGCQAGPQRSPDGLHWGPSRSRLRVGCCACACDLLELPPGFVHPLLIHAVRHVLGVLAGQSSDVVNLPIL